MSHPRLIHDDTSDELDIGQPGGTLWNSGDAEASYDSLVGEIECDKSRFVFAATNQVFENYLGVRTSTIYWEGDLRMSPAGRAAIEQQRDDFQTRSGLFTFIDDDGTEYSACTIKRFTLGKKMRIQQRGDLVWHRTYRIELEQLEP